MVHSLKNLQYCIYWPYANMCIHKLAVQVFLRNECDFLITSLEMLYFMENCQLTKFMHSNIVAVM